LILWPETAVPFFFTERPDALAAIGAMLQPGQMLVTGAVREEASGSEPLYYNSVIAIDDGGEIVDAVDKVHLVPFGEYIPLSDLAARAGIWQLVAGPMNFVAGSQRHPLALPGGVKASPFICYEIIFPELVAVDAQSTRIIWGYAWPIPALPAGADTGRGKRQTCLARRQQWHFRRHRRAWTRGGCPGPECQGRSRRGGRVARRVGRVDFPASHSRLRNSGILCSICICRKDQASAAGELTADI
jgi:hypothetical protein